MQFEFLYPGAGQIYSGINSLMPSDAYMRT